MDLAGMANAAGSGLKIGHGLLSSHGLPVSLAAGLPARPRVNSAGG